MPWTNVAKPSSQSYTNSNPRGKEQYDQSSLTYDDSGTYYDGVNYLAYTKVTTPSVAWNLGRASFVTSYDVSAQCTLPEGLFFKPDGTKMYISDGDNGAKVYEYSLSAWDLSTLSFVQSKDLSADPVNYPDSLFFKSDGLKMYVINSASTDFVNEYDLSTAWNISTATFLQRVRIPEDTTPTGIYFNPDGTIMFLVGNAGAEVNQYDLYLPWNVSTIVFRQRLSIATQTTDPDSVYFKYDGSKMYISNAGAPSSVFEYNLSLPWDIGTATYSQTLLISASDLDTFAAFFRNDGLKLFVTQANPTGSIREYTFSELWTNVNKPT